MRSPIAVMLFTRDLRVADNPALAAAAASGRVLPAYILATDPDVGDPNPRQLSFLADSLADLDESLRALGATLTVRSGPWVEAALHLVHEVGATELHVAEDVEPAARRRLDQLTAQAAPQRVAVYRHPGMTVVPPGQLSPAGGGEYKVFGAYYRAWQRASWRVPSDLPAALTLPDPPRPEGHNPLVEPSGRARIGGESAGLKRLAYWSERYLAQYPSDRDDLAGVATSRLSPYLRFGCLSARQIAAQLLPQPGGTGFVRQLCWRDFFYQLLAIRPEAATLDYRSRGVVWRSDPDLIAAWREGRTGYPVVDAGMRQLELEGFLPNRARMIVASFLTRDLGCDWRIGADHFMSLLVDADLAINQLNWQWVAGTGTGGNPHRVFNPIRQGKRFDREGHYLRRYLPELAGVPAGIAHDPDPATRRRCRYPDPIVDHDVAVAAYRAAAHTS